MVRSPKRGSDQVKKGFRKSCFRLYDFAWVLTFLFLSSCSLQIHPLSGASTHSTQTANLGPSPTPASGATQLKFVTATQSELTWACTAVAIERKDAANISYTVGTTTFNLSGTSAQFFSDSSCLTSISTATIVDTTSAQTVYVRFTAPGTFSITASLSPLLPGSQINTVTLDPYTWLGTALDHKWSTAANWFGGVAPTQAWDHAIFDGNCVSCNAEADAGVSNLNILNLNLYSTYTGTLTQDTGVTLSLNTIRQEAGTFAGGNLAITSENLLLTGGVFTSTSGIFTFGAHLGTAIIANTFNANGGLVVTAGDNNTLNVNNTQFTNLTLHTDALDFYGTLLVSGNLTLDPVGTTASHSGTMVVLNGIAPQTIVDAQSGLEASDGVPLKINSTSTATVSGNVMAGNVSIVAGTLSLGTSNTDVQSISMTGGILNGTTGSLTTHGDVSFTGGTFNHLGGSVIFNGVYNTFVATGYTFYNLTLQNDSGSTLSSSIHVAHNLSYDVTSGAGFINGSIVLNGSGTITDAQNGAGGYLGSDLIINTAGSITLASTHASFGGFQMQAGSFNGGSGSNNFNANFALSGGSFTASSGTSDFLPNSGTFSVSGGTFSHGSGSFNFHSNLNPSIDSNVEFYNVNLLGSGGTVALLNPFQVDGVLTLNNTGDYVIGNTITVLGNVVNTQSSNMTSSFPTIIFSGTSAQTYSGTGSYLGPVSINKASGGVSLMNDFTVGGNAFSILSGALSLNGHALLDVGGTVSVSSGATLNCNGGCGTGVSCNLGSNKLQCASLANSGVVNP